MSITTETAGSESYCEHECEAGAMAIFRSASKSCPTLVGQVLRVMREQAGIEKVVIAPWWPVPDPEKYGQKVNLFGKWSQDGKPASGTKKVKRL